MPFCKTRVSYCCFLKIWKQSWCCDTTTPPLNCYFAIFAPIKLFKLVPDHVTFACFYSDLYAVVSLAQKVAQTSKDAERMRLLFVSNINSGMVGLLLWTALLAYVCLKYLWPHLKWKKYSLDIKHLIRMRSSLGIHRYTSILIHNVLLNIIGNDLQ